MRNNRIVINNIKNVPAGSIIEILGFKAKKETVIELAYYDILSSVIEYDCIVKAVKKNVEGYSSVPRSNRSNLIRAIDKEVMIHLDKNEEIYIIADNTSSISSQLVEATLTALEKVNEEEKNG